MEKVQHAHICPFGKEARIGVMVSFKAAVRTQLYGTVIGDTLNSFLEVPWSPLALANSTLLYVNGRNYIFALSSPDLVNHWTSLYRVWLEMDKGDSQRLQVSAVDKTPQHPAPKIHTLLLFSGCRRTNHNINNMNGGLVCECRFERSLNINWICAKVAFSTECWSHEFVMCIWW